jgi:hypothetical protein
MPDTPEEVPGDEWPADPRPSRYSVDTIRQRLDGIAKAQGEARSNLGRLQETVGKGLEGAAERGYVIRRIEDRLADLQTRFAVVEQNYVKAEQHEKELAPFRKWGSWIATVVIGGVVTGLMMMLFGKGGH